MLTNNDSSILPSTNFQKNKISNMNHNATFFNSKKKLTITKSNFGSFLLSESPV